MRVSEKNMCHGVFGSKYHLCGMFDGKFRLLMFFTEDGKNF